MKDFKVIVAGGRDFKDFELAIHHLDILLFRKGQDVEIISGGQVTTDKETGKKYGADHIGEWYATTYRQCKLKKFPADWGTHGKSAGPKRNKQMAEYADALVAFWDGKSRGTKNMIDEAKLAGLEVRVIMY